MRKLYHRLLTAWCGRNFKSTPKEVIIDQMNEPRPLPMGRIELDVWAQRIATGALVPTVHLTNDELFAFYKGQKFALAQMLMHLGPTESHKPDAYFIHTLRTAAVKQVAWAYIAEVKEEQKAKEEAEKKAKEEADCQTKPIAS